MEIRPVHIVDDDATDLSSTAQVVAKLGFPTVCYTDCEEFLRIFEEQSTGCIILELRMGGGQGFCVLEALAKRQLIPPVIVLTREADVPSVVRAYQITKVVAFLQKKSLSEIALLEAIQSALALDEQLRLGHARRQSLESRLQQLTVPELDVLRLLLHGADHAQISVELEVSRRTVENRRAKIMKKLGASCFPELVRIALDAGYKIRA